MCGPFSKHLAVSNREHRVVPVGENWMLNDKVNTYSGCKRHVCLSTGRCAKNIMLKRMKFEIVLIILNFTYVLRIFIIKMTSMLKKLVIICKRKRLIMIVFIVTQIQTIFLKLFYFSFALILTNINSYCFSSIVLLLFRLVWIWFGSLDDWMLLS